MGLFSDMCTKLFLPTGCTIYAAIYSDFQPVAPVIRLLLINRLARIRDGRLEKTNDAGTDGPSFRVFRCSDSFRVSL